jgi:hypothetical protein|tara:strand:+ start:1440 stop:1922 length:483 start_codon:yes stop_codon:yes gene_type:complete
MITVNNSLPPNSRVWVYQANRIFTSSELTELDEILSGFNASWQAHGTNLNSAIEVFYDQFIVFFVDQQAQEATGCSIDKSMGIVKLIQQKLSVDLLDRLNLTYRIGTDINTIRMGDFQTKAKSGEISNSTIVFNNLVETKADFLTNWETTAGNSWHNNLL